MNTPSPTTRPAAGRGLRRGALLLAAAALPLAAAAQQGSRWAEVDVVAGYGQSQLRWGTFDEYLSSYAAYNKAELKQAPQLSRPSTLSVGVLACSFAYLGYQRTRAEAVAELTSGSRRMRVQRGALILNLEPRIGLGKRVFVAPVLGGGFGSTRITQQFELTDGTASQGAERVLLGTFATSSIFYLGGLKLGTDLGPALVQVRATYQTHGYDKFAPSDEPALRDNLLPRHYDQYLAHVQSGYRNSYSLVDDNVQDDWRQILVQLEVGLRINRYRP